MAVLPRLVERCATTLKQVAEEDLLLRLFDFCRLTEVVSNECIHRLTSTVRHRRLHCFPVLKNPVELRNKCLNVSPHAAFRIQFNTTNGRFYFSYLPESEALSTVAGDDDDDDDDDDDAAMSDGDVESSEEDDDDDDEDDDMNVENEEEDLRQIKRSKLK